MDNTNLVESVIRDVKHCAVEVYNEVGRESYENIYGACLEKEFGYQGIKYLAVASMPFFYKGDRINGLEINPVWVVENTLLVKIDCFIDMKRNINEIVENQIRFTGHNHALLINFSTSGSGNLFTRVDLR